MFRLCLLLGWDCSQQGNSSFTDHTNNASDASPAHDVSASAEQVLSDQSNLS